MGLGRVTFLLNPVSPNSAKAVVLEGNYWKRRIEVVMREYHKWRIYYKKRVSRECPLQLLSPTPDVPPPACPPRALLGVPGPHRHRAAGRARRSFLPTHLGVPGMGAGQEQGHRHPNSVFLQLRKSSREGDLLAPKQVGAASAYAHRAGMARDLGMEGAVLERTPRLVGKGKEACWVGAEDAKDAKDTGTPASP